MPRLTLDIEHPLMARLETVAECRGLNVHEAILYALRQHCDAWESVHYPMGKRRVDAVSTLELPKTGAPDNPIVEIVEDNDGHKTAIFR